MDLLPILTPKIFSPFPYVRCAISTRRGGVSGEPFGMNLSFNVGDDPAFVRQNRHLFLGAVGCVERRLAQPKQCHSAVVAVVREPGWIDGADALVSNQVDLCLGISVADCLPIFLVDPVRRAIGAVHAGWRGTAGNIVTNAVERMKEHFGTSPSDLVAYLGPSAQVCCYEVGGEVARRFDRNVVQSRGGRLYLDIVEANVNQLRQSGVFSKNIETSELCTITENELLHSYRRDQSRSGRMLGVITMVGENSP